MIKRVTRVGATPSEFMHEVMTRKGWNERQDPFKQGANETYIRIR